MKIILLITIYFLFVNNCVSQESVIITYPTIVPDNRIWKIEAKKSLLIELTDFDKFSMCGQAVLSYPGVVLLREGENSPFNTIKIEFTNLGRVPYANSYTYSITPTETQVFYPGTTLMAGICIRSFEIKEYYLEGKYEEEWKKVKEGRNKRKKEELAQKQKEDEGNRKIQERNQNIFLKERATKVYDLKELNSNTYNAFENTVREITINYFKANSIVSGFNSEYNIILNTDTNGTQAIAIEKISGDELPKELIIQIEEIKMTIPTKIGNYYVNSTATLSNIINIKSGACRIIKEGSQVNYKDNIPPSSIKQLIQYSSQLKRNELYEISYTEVIVMGKEEGQINKTIHKRRIVVKIIGGIIGIALLTLILYYS